MKHIIKGSVLQITLLKYDKPALVTALLDCKVSRSYGGLKIFWKHPL